MAWNSLWRYCMILIGASQDVLRGSNATNITTTETVPAAVSPSIYTANRCPANCLGGTCTFRDDGSVDCSDGCNDGYTGKMCNFPCTHKCSKCERKKADVCIECGQGYFGKHCDKCPDVCGEQGCLSDGICKKHCSAIHVCGDKCLPGCEICNETLGKCQQCAYNLMGETCKTSCPDNCRSVCPTQNCTSPCDRDTGQCLHGCKPGFWGDLCEDQCSSKCLDKICNQTSGHCVKCLRGYHGHKCHLSCVNCQDSGCLQSSGTCKKCDAGYYGHKCTQTCINCSSNVCERTSGLCMSVSLTTTDIAMATTGTITLTSNRLSSVLWKYFVVTSVVMLVLLAIGVISYRFCKRAEKTTPQSVSIPKFSASGPTCTRPQSEHHYDEINETYMDAAAGRVSVVVVKLPEVLPTDSTSRECLLPSQQKEQE